MKLPIMSSLSVRQQKTWEKNFYLQFQQSKTLSMGPLSNFKEQVDLLIVIYLKESMTRKSG